MEQPHSNGGQEMFKSIGGKVFRDDAQEAFRNAIRAGKLSENPQAENYAGRFMYMHSEADAAGYFDVFKNRDTRRYLPPVPVLA